MKISSSAIIRRWVTRSFDTPHRTVRRYAEQTRTPLVTVTGVAYPRGKPCMVFIEHGFVGMKVKTIKAILS